VSTQTESCVLCDSFKEVQDHHISYDPEIKAPLCKKCHDKEPKTLRKHEYKTFLISRYGTANIPSKIRSELGGDKLMYMLNPKSAIIFNPNTPKTILMQSLKLHIRVLKRDMEVSS